MEQPPLPSEVLPSEVLPYYEDPAGSWPTLTSCLADFSYYGGP